MKMEPVILRHRGSGFFAHSSKEILIYRDGYPVAFRAVWTGIMVHLGAPIVIFWIAGAIYNLAHGALRL